MYGKSADTGSYMSRTYQIGTQLGSGGGGAVYMAWHTRLRKHVVIKMVDNRFASTLEVRRNEVEALKNIKSMHIPQVLDFMTENDYSFTIMEYIKGDSFDKLLNAGKMFTEPQIIKWYCQLASALDAIHNHDIYHRDIKPANIIHTIYGDACLIDFNSAMVIGNNTGVVSRSMGYASPEQYEYFKLCRSVSIHTGKSASDYIETALLSVDCRTNLVSGSSIVYSRGVCDIDWKLSDIYSLGATMFHFLTGKRPPVRADEVARISKLKGYSEGILKIIERSMRTNPSERFASSAELMCAISDI